MQRPPQSLPPCGFARDLVAARVDCRVSTRIRYDDEICRMGVQPADRVRAPGLTGTRVLREGAGAEPHIRGRTAGLGEDDQAPVLDLCRSIERGLPLERMRVAEQRDPDAPVRIAEDAWVDRRAARTG